MVAGIHTLRIYLDSCALNRLTDPTDQLRIQQEAEAVEFIFRLIEIGKITWVASSMLKFELMKNPDFERRTDGLIMLRYAAEIHVPDSHVAERGRTLAEFGYGSFDALHLAMAEASHIDWLLTTDDRFLRQMRRGLGNPAVKFSNPLEWVKKVSQ